MMERFKRLISPPCAIAAGMAWALTAMDVSAFPMGGLQKAQNYAQDIRDGLYAIVGVVAIIYLIYLAVMAFTEKKSWADFGWGVVHVSVAGGAVALGTWAWSLFST